MKVWDIIILKLINLQLFKKQPFTRQLQQFLSLLLRITKTKSHITLNNNCIQQHLDSIMMIIWRVWMIRLRTILPTAMLTLVLISRPTWCENVQVIPRVLLKRNKTLLWLTLWLLWRNKGQTIYTRLMHVRKHSVEVPVLPRYIRWVSDYQAVVTSEKNLM